MTPQEVLKNLRRNLDEDYTARPNSATVHFLPRQEMEALGLTKDSPLTEFMDKLTWGTYGRGGKDPLTYKRLRDCDTEHLQNLLITQRQIPLIMSRAIIAILQERYIKELIWSNDDCAELTETPSVRSQFKSIFNSLGQPPRRPKRLGRLRRWLWKLADSI